MVSHTTQRKIRLIEEQYGSDWREKFPEKSVDRIYNDMVGEVRKTLFCKLQPETKAMVDEMVDEYDTTVSLFMETLIQREYKEFQKQQEKLNQEILSQFTG